MNSVLVTKPMPDCKVGETKELTVSGTVIASDDVQTVFSYDPEAVSAGYEETEAEEPMSEETSPAKGKKTPAAVVAILGRK